MIWPVCTAGIFPKQNEPTAFQGGDSSWGIIPEHRNRAAHEARGGNSQILSERRKPGAAKDASTLK